MRSVQMVIVMAITIMMVGCGTTNQSATTNSKETVASEEDMNAIRQVVLDYIEGWFEGDSGRMGRSLHPELVKRTIRNGDVESLGADEMIKYTEQGMGERFGKQEKIEITILDAYENIATVKLESDVYIDYLHLGKINGEWRIINVLWVRRNQ